MKKIRVGILFGGKSAEHEVSLQSAKNIIEALDRKRYEPVLIGIDKSGRWLLANEANFLLNAGNSKLITLNAQHQVALPPESHGKLASLEKTVVTGSVDVIFPILHGPLGEDGTIQGLLKLANIPFVGADVLGSAVGMDKDVMKRLLRDAGFPIAAFIACTKRAIPSFSLAVKKLGLPFFVKPANMGSSIGASKVKNQKDFDRAIKLAFQFDTKIVLEEFIPGREIECAVLGNEDPIASIPGEIISHHEFYSYEAKYIDPDGAGLEIPAKLSRMKVKEVQKLAVKVFQALECSGLGRVDFFLTKKGKLYVNEINTIPGFTQISMYPKLFAASGIEYSTLIHRLIELALERFRSRQKLKTTYLG